MLIEFEDEIPMPSVIKQFVEEDDEFLARVERFVDIYHGQIKGVVRIEDEDGKLQDLLDRLSEKYELPI